MPQSSPRLSLPYIQGGQAQKHVTHNEAVEALDVLVQLAVQAMDVSDPPADASEGQSWIVAPAPTGDWAGRAGHVAARRGGGWIFFAPQPGMRAWVRNISEMRIYRGNAWQEIPGSGTGGTGPVDFDNLPGVGINAASDATNRLAVAAPATLFSHEGAGHQVKVNKAGAADTASLLFQSGWSGRAEIGLAGNDDVAVKVSADGATWRDALTIDAASGFATVAGITGAVIELADGAVATLPAPARSGAVLICTQRAPGNPHPLAFHGGFFLYDAGASPGIVVIGKGSGIDNLGGGLPDGTGGSAGSSGLAASDGQLHLQNRAGETLWYNLTFLGGLPGW